MVKPKSNRQSPQLINLIGRRFGRLIPIERGPNLITSSTWICRCDCGNITKRIRGSSLRKGRTTSCGCALRDVGRNKVINMSGLRFDRLVVIRRGTNLNNCAAWICQCDCGTIKLINGNSLRSGHSTSCGCKTIENGHARIIDMTGETFGRLTVIGMAGTNKDSHALWTCRCECGATAIVSGVNLRIGDTKSCGCWKRDMFIARVRTHGMKKTREYKSWQHAKYRCFNPECERYGDYGGRGITMWPEWAASFEAFYAYMGPRPPGTSLDRFPDPDGSYVPGNVRWATMAQQNNNKRPRRWHRKP